ncbi:hypothetical protein [Streptosporangium sp. NPDC006007]|uniref:hypothetical protein n=1 Tax=Streptosporangium sp. NPDC006007 TaxID=3154575 RepID=UPI0033AA8228
MSDRAGGSGRAWDAVAAGGAGGLDATGPGAKAGGAEGSGVASPGVEGFDAKGFDAEGPGVEGARGVPGGAAGSVDDARAALARAQAELLTALVAGGEAPPGFDVERLRVQTAGLIAKRRGAVARLRPDLVTLLGGDFAAEFDAYARGRPRPPGGSHADARDFAEELRATGRAPDGLGPGHSPGPGSGCGPGPELVPEPRVRPGRWFRRWFRFRGGAAPRG